MDPIQIIGYHPEHQPFFEAFNRYWIEKYFWMEEVDEWVLTRPEEAIIEPGGAILMATYNGTLAGTVALRKVNDHTYEFTKMAVADKFQRKGIAEALSHASFIKARELGAEDVILYSNSVLHPAISLYEKLGFQHIPMERAEYKRSDVKMRIKAAGAELYQPTGIKVIRVDASYATAIASIGKIAFRNAFEHLFNKKDELDEYLAYTYEHSKLAASIRKENNVYLVALLDGEPVGFAKVKKHSLNEQIGSFNQMELQKIYVLPQYHGTGAGQALMQGIVRLANEVRPNFVWLDTHFQNDKAIRFYEKNGFTKQGKHFFTIGTQTFEYDLMALPVIISETAHAKI